MNNSPLALFGGPKIVTIEKPPDWPIITNEEIEAVTELLKKRVLSIYDRSGIIEEFEDNFARYHGIKYALTHNSGTSSLHAAFFAVGIGPGDEVIAPTYTFLATVVPVLQSNGIPVLADLDPEILTIDPEEVEKNITPQTKAIVVTHIWGHPVEMDEIMRIAKKNNLFVIEDCSHAHGATYKGQKVGTIGDIGCFSLEGHKAMIAGEGGMLITNNQHFYERAMLLGHFGQRIKQEVKLPENRLFVETGFGHKYRMHPLAATIANIQLKYLDTRNEMRKKNLDYLSEKLSDVKGVEPPLTKPYVTRGGFYGYKPVYKQDELKGLPIETFIEALKAEGVKIKRPGSKPLHLLPLFQDHPDKLYNYGCPWKCPHAKRNVIYKAGDLPKSEEMYAKLLSMPTFTEPAMDIIDQYIAAFNKIENNVDKLLEYSKETK